MYVAFSPDLSSPPPASSCAVCEITGWGRPETAVLRNGFNAEAVQTRLNVRRALAEGRLCEARPSDGACSATGSTRTPPTVAVTAGTLDLPWPAESPATAMCLRRLAAALVNPLLGRGQVGLCDLD